MFEKIICVGLLAIIPVSTFIFLTIAALRQEIIIRRLKEDIKYYSNKRQEDRVYITKLETNLPRNFNEVMEENAKLRAQNQDLLQLRELDREARKRLSKENDLLHKNTEYQKELRALLDNYSKLFDEWHENVASQSNTLLDHDTIISENGDNKND